MRMGKFRRQIFSAKDIGEPPRRRWTPTSENGRGHRFISSNIYSVDEADA
jgi:hypothetical protein